MALTAAPSQHRRVGRRVASWILVVLTGIAVTGSVIGLWVHRTVLDTNAFMAAMTPIAESESVRVVLSDRISDQLVEALSLETRLAERLEQTEARLLERLAEALELPDRVVDRIGSARLGLEALAPVIAAGVETRIREAVAEFVSSPEGTRLLLQTIEVAHQRSVLLLRDELDQLPNVVVAEGEVRLNLVPVMAEVLRSLVNAGLDVIGIEREIPPFDSTEDARAAVERLASVVNRDLPADFGQVRIASEATLERAQGLVQTFDLAVWALVIAAMFLALVAVWLAPTIPTGLVRIGAAATIAAIVGWVLVQVIAAQLADAAATADGRAAVGDIARSLVSGLNGTAFTLVVIGIGAVAAGIVADRQRDRALMTVGGDQIVVRDSASPKETSPERVSPKRAPTKPKPTNPSSSTGSTRKRRRPPSASA